MYERQYSVTLLSDVVITADAATVGGHQGLDYLPGSLFLGAVAAQSQREAGRFDPDFFLSGHVRFLDALPAVGRQSTIPIPLSYHRAKGTGWEGKRPYSPLAEAPPENGQQPQQWRRGYMTEDGRVTETALQHRMKNSIDREQRRSAEGELFGYQSIPSESVFHLRVQADTETDLQRVDSWLGKCGLRVGRSRSAEYGAVRIERLSVPSVADAPPHPTPDKVVLFLESDLALTRDGMPVLLPDGTDFGIAAAVMQPEKCFIRTRRYAPWNSFFNCRMSERQVLCKGSVITFRTTATCDLGALQNRLAVGIGLHREEGLGQIRVNPKWLFEPPMMAPATGPATTGPATPDPKTPLTKYLLDKTQRHAHSAEAFGRGLAWAKEWFDLSEAIAKEHRVPGKAQWANIRELAVRCLARPGLLPNELDEYCTQDLRSKQWVDAAVRGKGQERSLYGALLAKLRTNPDRQTCLTLYHGAVEMSRKLSRQTEGKGTPAR